jgi:nitroreductase
MIGGKEMLELLISRQSNRHYKDKPVEKDKLDRIIEAARMSPSASNAQPWKFIIVDDQSLIEEIARAATVNLIGLNNFIRQAPVVIVIVRQFPNFSAKLGGITMNRDYSHIDMGIAASSICNQAHAEGLGSCIIGWYIERRIRKILSIPGGRRIELMITIGYSDEQFREKRRKPYNTTVSFNKY